MFKKLALLLLSLVAIACYAASTALPPPNTAVIKHQISQMQTAGMIIMQQGDRLTIIIPTDQYFEPMSTRVKGAKQKELKKMAMFVKKFASQYPLSVIKVTGYTDEVYNLRSQLELSQSYAGVISSYLFDAGIHQNRIATEGRGSSEPIAEPSSPNRAALNRRVVIQVN
ncbi:MAG: OmpA family protein [Proteobacteria bacterium]|nr:OmpA family protein [Pseudomonadota bacterium]